MSELSNSEIERLAVNSILNEGIRPNSFLRIDIPVGDKAPSFDGSITIFKDNSDKAESYINEVPVQVKGTQVTRFSEKTRTFSLNTTHYENFYKRGGCLLLVVEVLNHYTTKIFYRHLLAIDLYEISRDYGHQGTHSVRLRELENTTLYNVCMIFSEQMILQPKVLIESNKLKEANFEKVMLTSPTFHPKYFSISEIFDHSFYQYGIKDDMEIPLRTVSMTSISFPSIETIEILDDKIEAFIETKIDASKNLNIKIENTVEIIIDTKTNKIKFIVIRIHSISSQIKVLKILEKIFETGIIQFSSFYGEIDRKKFEEQLINLKKDLDFWNLAAEIFSELGVSLDTEFENSDNIYSEINYLIKMIRTHDYSKIVVKNPEKPSFLTHYVGGIYLILFYKASLNDKFTNPFTEFFLNSSSMAMIVDSPPKSILISPFLLLEEETLIHAKNLDFEVITDSYKLIDLENIDSVFGLINNFCLRCLKTFDLTSDIRFIDLILPLFSILEKNTEIKDLKDIIFINKMQTNLRKNGSFNEKEFSSILDFKISTTIEDNKNIELIFCLNVLLNNQREAKHFFDLFTDEQKNVYEEMPIFTYFKN